MYNIVHIPCADSIAQHLNIVDDTGKGDFAVIGFSSGGPNAMAVTALSRNVRACGLVSSDVPYAEVDPSVLIGSWYEEFPEKIDVPW